MGEERHARRTAADNERYARGVEYYSKKDIRDEQNARIYDIQSYSPEPSSPNCQMMRSGLSGKSRWASSSK